MESIGVEAHIILVAGTTGPLFRQAAPIIVVENFDNQPVFHSKTFNGHILHGIVVRWFWGWVFVP